jgi:hypothetical protein
LQPVPLTVPAGNVFTRWGLAVRENQIPQLVANIAKGQQEMELLESGSVRPRQARYQAALRPDMHCFTHSKALSNLTPNPNHHFCP